MRRVELIPEWSAARWFAVMVVATILGVVPVAAVALLLIRSTDDSVAVPLVVGAVAISALEYIPVFKLQTAQRREAAAGYTSMRWPKDLTLDQVDPTTGMVLREGGTPRLSAPEYRLARAKTQNPLAF